MNDTAIARSAGALPRPSRAAPAARARSLLTTGAVLLLLTAAAFLFLVPIFWMVSTSLKPNQHVFDLPIRWIPDRPLWSNYPAAYTTVRFTRFFVNSAIVTGCVTIINIALSAL